jgi:hypothetical protein
MFTNFKIFEPYMTSVEAEKLNDLYTAIHSKESSLENKLISYRAFNELVERIRYRIRKNKKLNNCSISKKVIPIWYNSKK